MKKSELEKILKKAGCYSLEAGTKHEKWWSPISKKQFTLPRHKSKDIGKGLAEAILEQAGLK